MNKFFLSAILVSFSFQSFAQDLSAKAIQYVPGGTVVEVKKDEVKVKTPKGSIVEVEFSRSGELDEASGDMIENDVFVPGNNQKALAEIANEIKAQGYQAKGDWSYDDSFMKGWHYEVDAFKDGKEYEVLLDAKTGKITKAEIDD